MRWDSPLVLALAGTLAIHTIFVVALDAVVVIYPYRPAPPAPRVELVEVEVPPAPPKPPPPPVAKPEEPAPVEPPKEAPKPRARAVKTAVREATPPPTNEPPPPTTTDTTPGGEEVVTLDEAPPAATGVAVKVGKRTTGRVGRGGSGGGTGAGSGSGAGSETPPPVSVATIKKPAMPKGDYGYFNTGADYPPAAKQLGIEGPIRVRLIVDDKGKVKQAVLLNKLGHGLDELALSRAKKIEFEPAKDTDDRPVASVVVWTFHMTLPK